jgi:hypothetical protein
MSNQCTTCHYACDCREAKFKRLLEIARKVMCYVPWAYDSGGPKAELEQAIKECDK